MIDAFREQFNSFVLENLQAKHRIAELWIDAETTLGSLTLKTVQQIDRLAPFGHGNSRPLLTVSDVELVEPPKKIGNDRHLSFRLKQHGVTMRGVAFGGAEWYDDLVAHQGLFKFAFRPVINHFQGRNNVEVQITDWHPNHADVSVARKSPAITAG